MLWKEIASVLKALSQDVEATLSHAGITLNQQIKYLSLVDVANPFDK